MVCLPLIQRGPGRPPIDDDDIQAILGNERRRRIYELIEARPGIPALEIKRTLDLGGGVLDNHLGRLLRSGLVETRRSGWFVRLYPAGKAPDEGDPVLLPESTKQVARLVLRKPGRTSGEMAEQLKVSRLRVNGHLRVLAARGLVRPVADGRQTRHEPTARLKEAVKAW